MKQWHVHYLNKYPDGQVRRSETAIDVFAADGSHRVALRKNGANMWVDESEEHGLPDRHDLAPIPKDARVHKVVDGKIGFDDQAESRKKMRDQYKDETGRVKSCHEIGLARFDREQRDLKSGS